MNERVVQFGAGTRLVGVLSEPDRTESVFGLPAVVLLNAGTLHRIGPHRVYVKIARSLAKEGFAVLRFDLSGLGDSPPRRDNLPYSLSSIRESREAMECVSRETGAQEFVLAGLCGGADLAFQLARDDPRVIGLGLLDWYAYGTAKSHVRRHLLPFLTLRGWRKLLLAEGPAGARLRHWLGWPFLGGRIMNNLGLPPKGETVATLRALMGRGGHLLCVYTGALGVYNYRDQFADAFRSVPFEDRLRVDFQPHADHTLTLLHHQRRLVEVVREWAVQAWLVKREAQVPARGADGAARQVKMSGRGRVAVADGIRIAPCRHEDVPTLMEFIDRRWRAGHVLSRDRKLLEWQYDPGLVAHGGFEGPTLQLAWRGDTIVGMLGLTGFVFNLEGTEHPGVWLSIWYVGRECRGHNVAVGLVGSVRDLGYEVIGGLGANAVAVQVFRALRFEVLPSLPRWVAVFDVHSTSRLLTGIGDRVGANALPAWCSRHRVAPGPTTSAVDVVPWSARLADTWDALWRSRMAPGLVGTARNASYLQRRYVGHPRFRYEVLVALERRSGAALGCSVFRIEQIRGRAERALRIVEFLAQPEAEASLADAVVRAGYESGVSYADFYCSSARFAGGLERVGFVLEQGNGGSPRLPSRLSPPEAADFAMSAVLRCPLALRGRVDELRQAGRLYLTKSDGDQDRPN